MQDKDDSKVGSHVVPARSPIHPQHTLASAASINLSVPCLSSGPCSHRGPHACMQDEENATKLNDVLAGKTAEPAGAASPGAGMAGGGNPLGLEEGDLMVRLPTVL